MATYSVWYTSRSKKLFGAACVSATSKKAAISYIKKQIGKDVSIDKCCLVKPFGDD